MGKEIVFIGVVYAGFPSPARDYEEEDLKLRDYLQHGLTSVYLARVQGSSMIGANIPDGAMVIIDKALKPSNNSIVIASLEGANVLKRLIKTADGWWLASSNPQYAPIKISDGMEVSVWGVVTHVIINLVSV